MNNTFSHYIRTEQLNFKYAYGKTDFTGREYHLYHEILLFLNGNAEFYSESAKCSLTPGTLIIIPKEHFHRFQFYKDAGNYKRCVLNFEAPDGLSGLIEETMNEIRVIPEMNETLTQSFDKLMKTIESDMDAEKKKIMLKAIFPQILLELLPKDGAEKAETIAFSTVTENAVQYIKEHFSENISVSAVADSLHVSTSTLAHHFKNDLNMPVYGFILKKRLIAARRLIRENTAPSEAAMQCGFCDYSGFYRMYLKYFGITPRRDKQI